MSKLRFWPGETVRVTLAFTDLSDTPMSAINAVISARRPDGTTVTGTAVPVQGVAGSYYADFIVEQSGTWAVRGTCDGPTAAADETEFVVAKSLVGVI